MSNVRPWFRLSSIARPTSQGSSDPPPPQTRPTPRRPVIVRPPPRQPSPPRQQPPPSPPRQQPPPSPPRQQKESPTLPRQYTPPPPQEKSPYHSPPSRHMSPPTPIKATTPPPPPRSSYTPPPSPKEVQEALPMQKQKSPPSPAHSARSTSSESSVKTRSATSESEKHHKAPLPREVSPYSLPPSHLYAERETTQKNIVTAEKTSQVHETNQSQNNNYQGNNTKKMHRQPYSSDSENIMGARVITIAGENKGVVMEILRSTQGYKTGGTGTHSSKILHGTGEKGRRLQSSSSSSSDEGEGKKKTAKNPNNGNSNLPMKAFTNSNVQMINNSIVYNSTASHHDPGVHLRISRRPASGKGFQVNDYGYTGGYTD